MHKILPLLAICLFVYSCSKEEDIPFMESGDDSLGVISYHKIDGKYSGSLKNYIWVGEDTIQFYNSVNHSVTVDELNFKNVLVSDISNNIKSNAEAELFRLDETGGYLRFNLNTMADSTGIDSVYYNFYFGDKFNGVFYYGSRRLQYFFYYIQNKDTIYQYFDGTLQE